jgi:hypothetical protein
MVKFTALLFRNLPNGAHYNYCKEVSTEIANSSSVILAALGTLRTQFDTWLGYEKEQMDWVWKSDLTKKIENGDRRMDRALTSLKAQVRVQEYSLTQNIAEAAGRIYTMLKKYGTVTRKPYEEQEGDVRTIIEQLSGNGAYVADANTIGLGAWVNELQASFTLFRQLLLQRDAKSLQKPDKTFKEVRRGIEGIYHQIEAIINAGVLMNASPAYATFINRLNPEIERLNGEYRRVLRDVKDAQPAPIQEQTYTGKPLTPPLNVLYVTPHDGTVQLELGKDYNVTYKKNTEVGIAECTIHGKGLYKGSRTVTFAIVHAT